MLQFIKDVFEDMRLSALALLGGVDAGLYDFARDWRDEHIDTLLDKVEERDEAIAAALSALGA